MLSYLISIKDAYIKRFGNILGYILLVVSALVSLSILGFLIRAFFKIAIGIFIICCALFGIYKLSEVLKSEKQK
ncbi:MAG: hypothetical protein GX227_06035 [Clostridiaceae bacterium]|jgi:hypothetical protein|nr:hypothetical protein [Clostridiaceae bacterium]